MATVTWIGATDNAFSTGTNWDNGTGPASGDDVVFDGAFPVTGSANCTWDVTTTFNTVDIQSGYTGTITASATINVGTNGTFTFNGTGTLDFAGQAVNVLSFDASGSATKTLTMGATVLTCAGNFNISGSSLTFNEDSSEVIITETATISTVSGHEFYNLTLKKSGGGNSTVTLGTDIVVNNTLNYNDDSGGGIRTIDGNSITVYGSPIQTSGSGATNGTTSLVFGGGSAQSWIFASAASLDLDVVINKSGDTLTFSSTIYHGGDYTYTAGTVAPSSQIYQRTGTGNVASSGQAAWYDFKVASGTTTFTSNIDIDNDLTIDSGATLDYGSNTINLAGHYDRQGSVTVGGTFIFDSGTTKNITGGSFADVQFSASSSNYTLQNDMTASGSLTIDSGVTFNVGPNPTYYNVTVGGSWSNAGTFAPQSGLVLFNGSGTIDDGGNDWYNVEISGSYSFSNSTVIGGYCNVSGGSLSSGFDITVSGATYGNGSISMSAGTFTASGSGDFGGNSDWTFHDLTIANAYFATVTKVGSGNIIVSNDFSYPGGSGGGSLTAGSTIWSIAGNASIADGFACSTSTFKFTATDSGNTIVGPASPGSYPFYHLQFDGAGGSWDLMTNAIKITNALSITNGIFDLNGLGLTMTGASFGNDDTLRLNGTEAITDLTMDVDSGIVIYDGGSVTGLAAGNAYYNLKFDGTGSPTFTLNANLDVDGDFILAGSNTLDAVSYTINVAGDFTTTGTFTAGTGEVIFDGTSTWTDSGATFNNLTLAPGSTVHVAAGYTYSVTGLFTATSCTFDSASPATQATFNVAGTQSVATVTATDIDSSGGNTVDNVGGTNTNTINWINSSGGGGGEVVVIEERRKKRNLLGVGL